MTEFDTYRLIGRYASPVEVSGGREMFAAIGEDVDWPAVFRVAGEGLVTPALAGVLQRKGVLELLPEEPRQYLHAIRQLNRERNETLRVELLRVIGELNGIGVQPLLLKGAISLVGEQYAGCEDRVIGDLDLAVPFEQEKQAFDSLCRGPYEALMPYGQIYEREGHHHAPPLLHESLPVSIELHRGMLVRKYDHVMPIEQVWGDAGAASVEGVDFRVPHVTDQLLQSFVHAQLQDYHHFLRRLPLRAMFEFAGLRAAHDEAIDWMLVKNRLGARYLPALEAFLCAVEDLFGQPPPAGIPVTDTARRYYRGVEKTINSPATYAMRTRALWVKRIWTRLVSPAWYRRRIGRLLSGGASPR